MKTITILCLSTMLLGAASVYVKDSADYSPASNKQARLIGDVREEWVRHYGSGYAPAYDEPAAIAVDNSGNIYITGSSSSKPYGMDYLTVKYNTAGTVLWTARYNGNANGDDFAAAIAVDNSGNVYVTGKSWSGSSFDFATIKYDSSGVQQWEVFYDGPAHGWDEATALTLDIFSNVLVTGWSMGSSSFEDCATIKYDAATGTEKWISRYIGAGLDKAAAIAVDNSGNVYFAGTTTGTSTGKDFLTVKYDSLGTQKWASTYAGATTSTDEATDLVVDSFGNVYVTGASGRITSDYLTIKYSPAGVEQWSRLYNGGGAEGATAIGLAPSGDSVYVTGWSQGSIRYEYATIKYDAFGEMQWQDRYAFRTENTIAKTLVVGLDGSVYVTGHSRHSFITIKYNPSGQRQWLSQFEDVGDYAYDYYSKPVVLVVDSSANVYVAGLDLEATTSEDYATIKYNAVGAQQWVKRYNGPGNSYENATALAVDKIGNVYVAGYGDSLGTSSDFTTAKYSFSGLQEWVARYNGTANLSDQANAVATDGSSNVYVTGVSNRDYATIKYNLAGQRQWVVPYNGPGNSIDEATAIAVDRVGDIYVTGRSVGSNGLMDFFTIKYDKSRSVIWNKRYDGTANGSDEAVAIAVDDSQNVYITGKSQGMNGPYDIDYVTIKYDSLGNEKWVRRYQSLETLSDIPIALCIDKSGNVYVTGFSGGGFLTIKYNTDGEEQWTAKHMGRIDEARDLAVDGVGNVYVIGRVGESPDYNYATIKYNSFGIEQWIKLYNGPGNGTDDPGAIAVDLLGNIYVTGRSKGINSDYDFATIKYDSSGTEQWIARHNGPGNTAVTADEPVAIIVDNSGNVLVAGTSSDIFPGFFGTINKYWSVFTTIKYSQGQAPPAIAIHETSAAPNDTTQIPINITDAKGIAGVEFELLLDTSLLWVQKVEKTQLTAGFSLVWTKTDSSLKINMVSATPIASGSGALVNVTFKVNPTANFGDSTIIKFAKADLFDDNGRTIPSLNNDAIFRVIKPVQRGDVNADGDVGVPDAILCLRIVAGLPMPTFPPGHITPTPYEHWTADMNGNGEVGVDDAILILLKSLGGAAMPKQLASNHSECKIKINADKTNVQAGELVNVTVAVESEIEPHGGKIVMSYDSTAFSVAEVKAAEPTTLIVFNIGVPGQIKVTLVNLNGIAGPQGELVFIKLKAKRAGEFVAPLAVNTMKLFDANAQPICLITKVAERAAALPTSIGLAQNYPNPFNPETSIAYQLPKDAHVSLQIYNLTGQVVATLVNGKKSAGHHNALWNGRDEAGRQLPSGVYFYRLLVNKGEWAQVKKMTLLK